MLSREANLSPKFIKSVALAILGLARDGIQVFVATHSLFLLRELEIPVEDRRLREYRSAVLRPVSLATIEDLSHRGRRWWGYNLALSTSTSRRAWGEAPVTLSGSSLARISNASRQRVVNALLWLPPPST